MKITGTQLVNGFLTGPEWNKQKTGEQARSVMSVYNYNNYRNAMLR